MARRKTIFPEVQITRWFDHVGSDFVDVVPNAEGEFVQVWSAPRRTDGRYVTLSYQRTPSGPIGINSRIRIEGDTWESIETTGPRRTYYYRGDTRDYRYEEILPSGRLLVQDERRGETVKEIWTNAFDWANSKPRGKPLGNRAVQKLQAEGASYFVSSFQQKWLNGSLESETLVCFAEYAGDQFVKRHELPSEAATNE